MSLLWYIYLNNYNLKYKLIILKFSEKSIIILTYFILENKKNFNS